MLSQLSISNYALIESLDIQLEAGLNMLTGETGSGKSIVLGAIGLIIGDRADIRVVQEGQVKCIVEGTFTQLADETKAFFDANDLDFEGSATLRREITANGKSRAFINDTPVNLQELKELGMMLIDIHSQHQTIQINDPGFQLKMLDQYANSDSLLKSYRAHHKDFKRINSAIQELEKRRQDALHESEFVAFQLQELSAARLSGIDEQLLEEEYQGLAHAEQIREVLEGNLQLLSEGEQPVLSILKTLRDQLRELTRYGSAYREWSERVESVFIELSDIARGMSLQAEGVELNPARMAELDELRTVVFRLEQKYHAKGVEGLLAMEADLRAKDTAYAGLDDVLEKLKGEQSAKWELLLAAGDALTAHRKTALPKFVKSIEAILTKLNMKQAKVGFEFSKTSDPEMDGLDDFALLFSANPGHPPATLKKVASGGELSRLMLAIKKTSAERYSSRTLIFDEIDSGVSGEVAHAMGEIMWEMAKGSQLVAITHLPQIASRGGAHFKVHKRISAGQTTTHIDRLQSEERVVEIAQMLSGAKTSDAALANARELLQAP